MSFDFVGRGGHVVEGAVTEVDRFADSGGVWDNFRKALDAGVGKPPLRVWACARGEGTRPLTGKSVLGLMPPARGLTLPCGLTLPRGLALPLTCCIAWVYRGGAFSSVICSLLRMTRSSCLNNCSFSSRSEASIQPPASGGSGRLLPGLAAGEIAGDDLERACEPARPHGLAALAEGPEPAAAVRSAAPVEDDTDRLRSRSWLVLVALVIDLSRGVFLPEGRFSFGGLPLGVRARGVSCGLVERMVRLLAAERDVGVKGGTLGSGGFASCSWSSVCCMRRACSSRTSASLATSAACNASSFRWFSLAVASACRWCSLVVTSAASFSVGIRLGRAASSCASRWHSSSRSLSWCTSCWFCAWYWALEACSCWRSSSIWPSLRR
mmetsp:Transcript_71802/g.126474  ORF Transcript_71802/g.126474 Transcript_71802/m.126474 type:complete len:381 (-) Transcript_71802:780-1922(-)